jgi:hypothetical protein
MVGVSAPGRWMLAMASRSAVARACGSRRAMAISSRATSWSMPNTAAAEAMKIAAILRS